jgi:hypothetical protein
LSIPDIHREAVRRGLVASIADTTVWRWLAEDAIYFSVVQRKALTPSDFASLGDLEDRLLGFERRYEAAAQPFEWKFTRRDLTPAAAQTPPARQGGVSGGIRHRTSGPEH